MASACGIHIHVCRICHTVMFFLRYAGATATLRLAADMTQYIIYFNQQWVGDHSEEWIASRGPLANAVVEQMKDAGVYVFAGGLDSDIDAAFSADATSGTIEVTDGPFAATGEFLGGLAIVNVADIEAAKMWAGKVAEACGWPQEVRRFE